MTLEENKRKIQNTLLVASGEDRIDELLNQHLLDEQTQLDIIKKADFDMRLSMSINEHICEEAQLALINSDTSDFEYSYRIADNDHLSEKVQLRLLETGNIDTIGELACCCESLCGYIQNILAKDCTYVASCLAANENITQEAISILFGRDDLIEFSESLLTNPVLDLSKLTYNFKKEGF